MEIKPGDLITCKYKWGGELKEGIGYVYEVDINSLHIGISCKDGGCMNCSLDKLSDIKKVIVKQSTSDEWLNASFN